MSQLVTVLEERNDSVTDLILFRKHGLHRDSVKNNSEEFERRSGTLLSVSSTLLYEEGKSVENRRAGVA